MSAPPVPSFTLVLRPFLAVLLLTSCLCAPASAAGPESTRTALQRQMRWAGGASGALVMDLDNGQVLYSSKPDGPRVPASVEKLYTTSTALLRLGPQTQLETTVLADQPLLPDGVLDGDLYLRGSGDPTLGAPALEALAGELSAAGLLEVTGSVIGDETRFDTLRGPPSSKFQTSGYVGPLGALIYNRGRTGIRRPYFQVSPAKFAAEAFARALKKAGVKVAVKRATTGEAQAFAATLASWKSPPVAELVRRANVPSDNFIAETLLKLVAARDGEPGTTVGGAAVVRRTLGGLGIQPRVVDGSGLSRANRTTPRQVVQLLTAVVDDPIYPDFRASLAVAGRTGTLHDRMRRSPARDRCRGKTGTLQSVSALAGYCQTRGGALVAYAFLMNAVNPYGARTLQDRMLTAVAKYAPAAAR
jgi:D-alanyl-D-alanine carboxypeptidase/D-alanyl-D-alanine-endopeptidase (penicillin-binding protein 4)